MNWQTPLWKMGISNEEFVQLKEDIRDLFAENNYFKKKVNTKKISLYYAEWWRREYDGSAPSSERIADSLGIDVNKSAELFSLAKTGGEILGLQWIKKQNTLFFKTLLLQGGLPILHIRKNSNAYKNFLVKVLELHPRTVTEISENIDLTSLLPFGSRNEVIYESCLQIVDKIWNNEEDAFNIFGNANDLSDIGEALRKHKSKIEKENKIRRNIQVSIRWTLEKSDASSRRIIPELIFPSTLTSEELSLITGNIDNEQEYFIVIDGEPICQLRKSNAGNYRTFWTGIVFSTSCTIENKVELSIKSGSGFIKPLDIRGAQPPDLTIPCLLNETGSDELSFCQGRNTREDKAFVIIPEGWTLADEYKSIEKLPVQICGKNYFECSFENKIELKNNSESLVFKTKALSFEWQLIENKPEWMIWSSLLVTTGFPKFYVFNNIGVLIKNMKFRIRRRGEIVWQANTNSVPVGCIDYEINVDGTLEYGCFYNIGDLDMEILNQEIYSAKLGFHINGLVLSVYEENILNVKITNKVAELECIDNLRFPKEIRFRLVSPSQNKGLIFSIMPPFKGIKVIDSNQNILENNCQLYSGNLMGCRIISAGDASMRIYNVKRSDIYFEKALPKGSSSLIEYQEEISRLFRLHNVMYNWNSVFIEFRKDEEILNSLEIKDHNLDKTINIEDDLITITIENAPDTLELYAIQLDCAPRNIEPFPLDKVNGNYSFKRSIISKHIIFSTDISGTASILPFFTTFDPDQEDNPERIQGYCHKLKGSSSGSGIWLQAITYAQKADYYELPLIAFDHLRAISLSPKLCARFFCLLRINSNDFEVFTSICRKFEQELGMSFHWLSEARWTEALEWALADSDKKYSDSLRNIVLTSYYDFLCLGSQKANYSLLAKHIINKTIIPPCDFLLRTDIQKLRASIGTRINELPQGGANIKEEFRWILRVTDYEKNIWPVLLAPLAAALCTSGRDESVFQEKPHVRSNIQYIHWRFPQWYARALNYFVQRLSNN